MAYTLNRSDRKPDLLPLHPPAHPSPEAVRQDPPLLQMQAHWSVPAHRSYLHAANFHWQH